MQAVIHIIAHFCLPALVAIAMARWMKPEKPWYYYWVLMCLTMVIDLDHLLATPIYDPGRCSIGFHPLHSFVAIGGYVVLLFPPKTRIVAIGLMIHIGLDLVDCGMM